MRDATARPWAADPDYRAGMSWNVHIVQEENPDTRIAFMSNTPNSGTAQANAALIVKAVNLHDDLAGALQALLRHCETAFSGWPHSLGAVEVRDAARAVLVKAAAT